MKLHPQWCKARRRARRAAGWSAMLLLLLLRAAERWRPNLGPPFTGFALLVNISKTEREEASKRDTYKKSVFGILIFFFSTNCLLQQRRAESNKKQKFQASNWRMELLWNKGLSKTVWWTLNIGICFLEILSLKIQCFQKKDGIIVHKDDLKQTKYQLT